MSDNPYAAPQTSPTTHGAQLNGPQLASLGERFGGALIDGLIGSLLMFPLVFFVVMPMFGANLSDPNSTRQLQFNPAYIITGLLLGIVVFLLIHGYLLVTRGQTVGKMLLKTQIVDFNTGRLVSPGKLIGLRYILMAVIGNIPLIGPVIGFVGILLIFRSSRRCLHDEITGTVVVKQTHFS